MIINWGIVVVVNVFISIKIPATFFVFIKMSLGGLKRAFKPVITPIVSMIISEIDRLKWEIL